MYHRTGVVCLVFCLFFACSENSSKAGASLERARWSVDEPEPCAADSDCDDGSDCTLDVCVAGFCKHVKQFQGCCISNAECDDNNDCTIDACDPDTHLCFHEVDPANDNCCTSASDCNDFLVCTEDKCINYQCSNGSGRGCDCDDSWCWNSDDNPCTCDLCVYGMCRHLGPDQAPPSCNLPYTCCLTDSDCPPPSLYCQTVACNEDTYNCEYTDVGTCPWPLPYTQNFNSCASIAEMKWQIYGFGADASPNWKCTSLGPLGIDNHMRFHWAPQVDAPFESYLVTPPLETAGLSNITVQFDRYYNHYDGEVDLGLLVIHDVDEDKVIEFTDLYFPVWSVTMDQHLPAATVQYIVPSALLADWTYVGFRVAASNSFDLNHFDIDNVKVCPGVPPVWDFLPLSIAVPWDDGGLEKLTASDGDDDNLEFSLVSAPPFVSLQNAAKSWVFQNWSVELVVEPPSADDAGEYDVVVRVSDGCLHKDVTIHLTVIYTDAYGLWAPPEVAPEVLGPVLQALSANGVEIQLFSTLPLLDSLSELKGLFVVLGVYGWNHVLTQTEGQTLADYLEGGGRLYMEGGDTWAYDPWTDVHHYFQVKGLADGGQTFPGPVDGRHFCYGQNFNVALWHPVNTYIDQLAPKLYGGAIPLLRDGQDWGTDLALSYEAEDLGYRAIAASLPLAALVEMGQGTVDQLVLRYLEFFENGYPGCSVDQECDDGVVCTMDHCEDGHCENETVPDCDLCEDDRDCPENHACVLSNGICVDIWGQRFDSVDTPIYISPDGPGVYASTIAVPEDMEAWEVHVQVRIAHTYPGDLQFSLNHAGLDVPLKAAQPGLKGDGIFLTYDKGVDPVWPDALSVFSGFGMNGDWTLTVTDVMGLHGGKVVGWSLYVAWEGPCCWSDATCQANASACVEGWCGDCYCLYVEKTCDDNNPCTADWCEEPGGCQNQMKDCDDGRICTVDICDASTGECMNDKLDNCLGPCEGHDDCGLNDYCKESLGMCAPIPGKLYTSQDPFPLAIPDADQVGVTSSIVPLDGNYVWNLYVKVMITHGYSSDLEVTLSHHVVTLLLHDQTGGMSDNVYRVYGLADSPAGPEGTDIFDAWPANGQWTLTVTDLVSGDTGSLQDWRLFMASF